MEEDESGSASVTTWEGCAGEREGWGLENVVPGGCRSLRGVARGDADGDSDDLVQSPQSRGQTDPPDWGESFASLFVACCRTKPSPLRSPFEDFRLEW